MVVGIAVLAPLGVAELLALHPLATEHAHDGNPRFIYGAAVAAFVGFGLLAILGPLGRETDPE
jgi:hypothetical protein